MGEILKVDFSLALAATLAHEGGWSKHPMDPGGATMRGVTKRAWEAYVGHSVTDEQLRHLTVEQITPFYREGYWDPVRGEDLPGGVDALVFDICVNSGPRRAVIILQQSILDISRIGILKDGKIGPKTIAAAHAVNVYDLIDQIAYRRLTFYSQLRGWAAFKGGWRRRTIQTATFATAIATGQGRAMVNSRDLPLAA
ncbi:MAG: glycosyl hydrolase 108 family protein [Henriciella sp.]|uniref:glycoside hydrolase family 108 protein n=1 Tax=Henriciella sp. TaxID=1968823 RepID=UPI003C78B12A